MTEKPSVRISVRSVVETSLFEPDLLPTAGIMERMREGARAHIARQERGRLTEREYEAEVPLSAVYETEEICLYVSGRADAIFFHESGQIIEELKLGNDNNDLNPAHMAQAEIYGHMLCETRGIDHVCLMVRYVDTCGNVLKDYTRDCSAEALRKHFDALCAPVAERALRTVRREMKRDMSIETLRFPFSSYRKGQKFFSMAVYATIRDRKRLFAQAPTGIGKTVAAIYPAVHALRQRKCAGILFLSARGTGRRAAVETAMKLSVAGAKLYTVEIIAKAKSCPFDSDCRPEMCTRACGFYTRLDDALKEGESGGIWDARAISELAEKHMLCPFELSLEMAKQADLIICDYNYVYDPGVSIDAFLTRRGGMTILVDEAHRLCDRVRDDYSVQLKLKDIRELRRETGNRFGRRSGIYRALSGVITSIKDIRQRSGDRFEELSSSTDENGSGDVSLQERPWGQLSEAMRQVQKAAESLLQTERSQVLSDTVRMVLDWISTDERFSDRYVFLEDGTDDQYELGLYLLDAAPEILAVSRRARGVIYFSATLAPLPAAMRLLGSCSGDITMMLPSPFPPEALSVRIVPLDVRYQAREVNAGKLAKIIESFLFTHSGNSMVFFPSYAFMDLIVRRLDLTRLSDVKQTVFETRGMSEEERACIIDQLSETDGTEIVLFCVLGGSFSEGIDLPGSRLQNVAIISTGLPLMDARIRAMQAYYRAHGEDGFFYTMTLPGMVRVIQAAGRLIRTETDTGSLLLIDSRYGSQQIQALLEGTLIGAALTNGGQTDAGQ